MVRFLTSPAGVVVSSDATNPSIWTLPFPTVELDSTKSGRSVLMEGECRSRDDDFGQCEEDGNAKRNMENPEVDGKT